MLLSLHSHSSDDNFLEALRSLVARGRHAEADRMARQWRRRLPGAQGRVFLALRAEIALGLGRFAAALDWAGEALKCFDIPLGLLRALEGSRIRALLGLGRFREAQSAIESRYASIDRAGVDLRLFRGEVALHAGRLTEARAEAEQACALAASTRLRHRLVSASMLRARVAREQGDVAHAHHHLDRARNLCNGLRDASALGLVLSDRADLLVHSGLWAEAGRDAVQSGRVFARTSSPHEHLSAGRRTGLLGLAQGDPHHALPAIERAADVARRGYGATDCRAEIDLLLADAQLADRDPEGALERATAALTLFRGTQDPGGLARAHVRRSLAALSAGNLALAWREARIAATIGDAGPVAEGLADLALGRVLLRKERSAATALFGKAAANPSLYPPLRFVANLARALAGGADAAADEVRSNLSRIEGFGDRRILAIVRSDLRDLFGVESGARIDAGVEVGGAEDSGLEGEEADGPREFLPGLIGESQVVRDLGAMVRKAAPSDLPVSIYGETGTGKENVARALHELSPRSGRKFVPINAASSSDELFESTLFGHVRGSFTGAQTDRPGLVEDAKGGTLFIDEVADLSPLAQIRLLRFIQQGTYRRVGENHERRADVRIVVAANQPLEDLVAAGRFREDLFYRLRGLALTVPPLRTRGRDIVRLARHFVKAARGAASRLSAESEAEIAAHSWPGNVREMEQEMARATVFADSPLIEWRRPKAKTAGVAAEERATPVSLRAALLGFERNYLKSVLSKSVERLEAARILGISRQALHQKIVRYGL